jgi:hypothetical protein
MISVREYQEQLLATYKDRLARIERGEVWGSDHANPYDARKETPPRRVDGAATANGLARRPFRVSATSQVDQKLQTGQYRAVRRRHFCAGLEKSLGSIDAAALAFVHRCAAEAEHDAPEWQAAMEALILVAENRGPTMFARIGIMQAFNRHHSGYRAQAGQKILDRPVMIP